jgi:hypothetical protein
MSDQHILNSYLCDGLPVLFEISSDFYWGHFRAVCYVSDYFHHTVAGLSATS